MFEIVKICEWNEMKWSIFIPLISTIQIKIKIADVKAAGLWIYTKLKYSVNEYDIYF